MKKLGLIQTRGLGDIIIALPIAKHYHDQGWHVHWPIDQAWVEQMSHQVPWVKWIPVPKDAGEYFYDEPVKRLRNLGCSEILCLYNALTGHPEFSQEVFFQHVKFDQYKYLKAGVPFLNKWQLAECIERDPVREQALYDRVVTNPKYVVTHLTASANTVTIDPDMIPQGWQVIPITPDGYIFDWLKIIEGAESIIMTDSVMANLVDQLGLGTDRYFIPLSHIQLTPTHGHEWTWLENPSINPNVRIFQSS
jgi:hypothetical protein